MGNGSGVVAESLLAPTPALDRRQALVLVLRGSGEERVVVHDGDPLAAPSEFVLGQRMHVFSDGSAVAVGEVAYLRRVSVADAEARERAAETPAPVPVAVVGAVPAPAAPAEDDWRAWATDDLRAEARRLGAMDPRGAQESLDLAAISGELARRGAGPENGGAA
jgi:hypothetical protein